MINKLIQDYFIRTSNRSAAWIVIACLVCSVGIVDDASAQFVQFSSAGTSSNADSLLNNLAAKNKARVNPSLYRSKADSAFGGRWQEYQGKYNEKHSKYNETFGKYNEKFVKAKQFQTKYSNDVSKLRQYKLPKQFDKIDKFRSQYKVDEALGNVRKIQSLSDQILSGKLKLDSGTVLNNRMMQTYMDSLRKTLPDIPKAPTEEISREQLVKEVNDQFRNPVDSLRDSTKRVGQEIGRKKEWVDLNYARIKSADKEDLKPMVASLVKSHALKSIDSLRTIDLEATRMKMEEAERSAREKVTKFKEKQSMWDKSYLEGILGLANNKSATLYFSPAWAYHIVPSWSVGGGPNIIINKETPGIKLDVGARVLTKYEILHRTAYFQVEDQVMPGAKSPENKAFTQHKLMAGGGYVIPFFSPVTANLSVMYKFYSNGVSENDGSSWVFRIGISTNKKPK